MHPTTKWAENPFGRGHVNQPASSFAFFPDTEWLNTACRVRNAVMEPAKFVPRAQATTAPQIVKVTERAAKEIQAALKQETETFEGVRVGLMGGGCCGPGYALQLAKGPESGDVVVESGGVKVFVGAQDQDQLKGITLDFVETPRGAGFHIENPNVVEAGHGHGHGHGQGGGGCACGSGGGGGCGCGGGHGAEGEGCGC